MGLVVELGLDLVAGTAGTPLLLLGIVLSCWVAALDHKTFDDAVKAGAVVKTRFGQLLEILDMPRRNIRPEFENHFTFGGADDRDFAHK